MNATFDDDLWAHRGGSPTLPVRLGPAHAWLGQQLDRLVNDNVQGGVEVQVQVDVNVI